MKNSRLTTRRLISVFTLGILATLVSAAVPAAAAKVVSQAQEKKILKDPGTALLGTATGDITVVEYFDYNCPYCRKLAPSIHELVDVDRHVNVVFKEWPIFGGVSLYAARCALAAQWQGKYLAAHDALISAPRLAQTTEVDETLRNAGIDMKELNASLAAHSEQIAAILARNDAEAHSLGIRGTPGLLVGRDVSTGIGDLTGLQAAVTDARRL
jgi:protein-disulfide isomerase